MPAYEYECVIHGIFEETQSINDPPLAICPQCFEEFAKSLEPLVGYARAIKQKEFYEKTISPKRLISSSNFVLNGSGWAKDNYK